MKYTSNIVATRAPAMSQSNVLTNISKINRELIKVNVKLKKNCIESDWRMMSCMRDSASQNRDILLSFSALVRARKTQRQLKSSCFYHSSLMKKLNIYSRRVKEVRVHTRKISRVRRVTLSRRYRTSDKSSISNNSNNSSSIK